jgi:ABC-type molybdenum transport system ATPase subunit/photorepair protein PhrA
MNKSRKQAQQRYEQTEKGKEARRRATRKSALKLSNIRISSDKKELLEEISRTTGKSQKDITEALIQAEHKRTSQT